MSDTEDGDPEADENDRERPAEPDPTAHEPDEYDPESDLADPEQSLVDVPEPPSVQPESEVPKDLRKAFWKLVVVFNVALLSSSVGVMLVGFERRWTLGGTLVVLGVLSFLRGYHRYQRVAGDDALWAEDDVSE